MPASLWEVQAEGLEEAASPASWSEAGSQGPTQSWESSLTDVDQADGWEGVQAQALGCLDLLKAAGQTPQKVLALLAEAQPQVELQLGLHRPARWTEAPLAWKLRVG